ncbi:hypothetical protein [Fontibacillus sp. BL9]|uniref:hypothetical protein n=1 Tax=Fontibacillus sp. BL9 TaxID=3389971 RepID=UPI00397AEB7F
MEQRVDPDRILGLAQVLMRFNRTIENNETGLSGEIRSFLADIRRSYPEQDVGLAILEVERALDEVHDSAVLVCDGLDQKTTILKKTADEYTETEQLVVQMASRKPSVSWSANLAKLSSSNTSRFGSSADRTDKTEKPSVVQMLKGYFHQAQKWFLQIRLASFQNDPQIGELLAQMQNGTMAEQQQAAAQLMKINSAIQNLARCQAAYSVYSQYGNKPYMNEVHSQAEEFRKKLRELGISDSLVSANLSAYYTDSALNACVYDPRLSDWTLLPKAIWSSEDAKLSEDKQIAILMLTDLYFKATTPEARDEVLSMADGIRNGSLSTYALFGNKLDSSAVSEIVQNLVNSEWAFPETILSIGHDSKFAVFANSNLSYHEEDVNAVMADLSGDLIQAEEAYWNSGIYTEENWWLDEAKLVEALAMISRDARAGGISLPEVSGNKMAAIQYLLKVPVTKEWGMDTLLPLEAAMTKQKLEGDSLVLTEENLKAIIDRYVEIETSPGVQWGQVGVGVLQTIGGGLEAAFGVTVGTVTSPTVAGGLFGAFIATHGASNFTGGLSRIWNGFQGSNAGDTANFMKNAYVAVGGETGEMIYNGVDLAVAFAQPADIVTKMIYKSPTAAIDAYRAEKMVSSVMEGAGEGRLNTYGDALRKNLGSAADSHADEYNKILRHVEESGVKVDYRSGTLAYEPSFGSPGRLILDPDASIGAVRHEYRHMLDDFDLGHPGMRVIADSDLFWRLEYRGYMEEIKLAREIRDYDAGRFILQEMRARRQEILGR